MPVKSAKQLRFMEGVKSGSIDGMAAPSKSVAQEFLDATPMKTKSKFGKSKLDKFSLAMRKKKSSY